MKIFKCNAKIIFFALISSCSSCRAQAEKKVEYVVEDIIYIQQSLIKSDKNENDNLKKEYRKFVYNIVFSEKTINVAFSKDICVYEENDFDPIVGVISDITLNFDIAKDGLITNKNDKLAIDVKESIDELSLDSVFKLIKTNEKILNLPESIPNFDYNTLSPKMPFFLPEAKRCKFDLDSKDGIKTTYVYNLLDQKNTNIGKIFHIIIDGRDSKVFICNVDGDPDKERMQNNSYRQISFKKK